MYQELLEEQEQPDPDLYARLGFALAYLGNLQMGLGQTEQAEKNCRRSLELLDNLPNELGNSRTRQQSAFARYVLGNILTAKNKRSEAERLYQEACDLLTPLGDDAEAHDLLGSCYMGLSKLSNNLTQSNEHCRRALEINEELYKKYPNNRLYCYHYGQILYNPAFNARKVGGRNEAETLLQQCIALLQPIVARGSTEKDDPASRIRSQIVLMHCYGGLGMLWSDRGKIDESEQFHRQAIAVSQELVRIYPHPDRRRELGQCYLDLGTSYLLNNRAKKAEEFYRKAVAIQEALVHDLPDIGLYRLNLAGTCVNLGLRLSGDRAEEAVALFHKSRELIEPLWRAHPEDEGYARILSGSYNNEAQLLRNRGEPRKALPLHDRSVEVSSTALRLDPTNAAVRSTCEMALGSRAQTWGLLEEHKKALADWDRLLEVAGAAGAAKYRTWRAWSLASLGDHRQALEDVERYLHRSNISLDDRFYGATGLSSLIPEAQKDPHLTSAQRKEQEDGYAARALEVLTQLRREGYFYDPAKQQLLEKDEDLAPLRSRADFQHWRAMDRGQPAGKAKPTHPAH